MTSNSLSTSSSSIVLAGTTATSSSSSQERPAKRRKIEPRSNGKKRIDLSSLIDDSTMPITSDLQWREALLYNLGATTFPDGINSIESFTAAWQVANLLLLQNI
jgi:hypothetical protein